MGVDEVNSQKQGTFSQITTATEKHKRQWNELYAIIVYCMTASAYIC